MNCKVSHIFAWIGVIIGTCIIGIAAFIITHDATRRLKSNENNGSMDIILSYREIYEVFLIVLLTGCAKVALNATGLRTDKTFQIFYRVSVLILFGLTVFWTVIGYLNFEHYKKLLLNDEHISIEIWQVGKVMFPNFVKEIEEKYSCCGWYNVFDHCTPYLKAKIIFNALENNALKEYTERAAKFEDDGDYYNDESLSGSDYTSSNASNELQSSDYDSGNSSYEGDYGEMPEYGARSVCTLLPEYDEPFYLNEPCFMRNNVSVKVNEVCRAMTCALDGCSTTFSTALEDKFVKFQTPLLIIMIIIVISITGAVIVVAIELYQSLNPKRRQTRRLKSDEEAIPLTKN